MRATQTPAAPSIFGAAFGATGFGAAAAAAGGFDPSKFASAAPAAKAEDGDEGEGEGDEDVEAECKAEFKPVVKLEIIEGAEATTTGEEDEDILFEAYVFERSRVCVRARARVVWFVRGAWASRARAAIHRRFSRASIRL